MEIRSLAVWRVWRSRETSFSASVLDGRAHQRIDQLLHWRHSIIEYPGFGECVRQPYNTCLVHSHVFPVAYLA